MLLACWMALPPIPRNLATTRIYTPRKLDAGNLLRLAQHAQHLLLRLAQQRNKEGDPTDANR